MNCSLMGLLIGLCLFYPLTSVHAQTQQYQQQSQSVDASTTEKNSGTTDEDGQRTAASNPAESKLEEREDQLNRIEKHYWQAKDSQFHVVQNRRYVKEKRIYLSGMFGPMVNDQFSDATAMNLSAGYHFSERWGAELNYLSLDPEGNTMTNEFVDRFGVVPNHNKLKNFIGVTGNWVPVYAKASLHNSFIMYFDFSIGLGLGALQYEQQFTDKANETQTTPALALDLTQQVFLSNNMAVKVSYMARWFNEVVKDSRSPFETRSEGLSQTNLILVGITYFH